MFAVQAVLKDEIETLSTPEIGWLPSAASRAILSNSATTDAYQIALMAW
jgi:hypothetical protein